MVKANILKNQSYLLQIKLEYLKLIQPTHDTMGKKQYINKVKRGVMKVKDLMDLINLNSNQGVIKGLPSNLLGEPRFVRA